MPLPHQHLVGGSGSSPRHHLNVSKDVANGPKKEPLDLDQTAQTNQPGEHEKEDFISKHLSELQEELFESLKEDISDWIIKTLGDVGINAENFIYALDTGVILCQLTKAIETKAREAFQEGKLTEPLPDYKLHCNKNAKSGTWFARDNTANFLCWCRAYGMIDESLFDSEDLVTHHQERQVIYCLMELARVGARFGLEPPSLICMEREIEYDAPSTPPPTAPKPPVPPVKVVTPERSPPATPPSPPPPPPPPPRSTTPPPSPPPPRPPPAPLSPPKTESSPSSRSSTVSTLDSEVNRVSTKCKCQDYVNRLSEGVYDVFGKRVFIRESNGIVKCFEPVIDGEKWHLLKGKHLMVRVGGGWDTFENYLIHHDPVQVFEFHHNAANGPAHSYATQGPGFEPGAFNGYLVIRSKYKSKNFY